MSNRSRFAASVAGAARELGYWISAVKGVDHSIDPALKSFIVKPTCGRWSHVFLPHTEALSYTGGGQCPTHPLSLSVCLSMIRKSLLSYTQCPSGSWSEEESRRLDWKEGEQLPFCLWPWPCIGRTVAAAQRGGVGCSVHVCAHVSRVWVCFFRHVAGKCCHTLQPIIACNCIHLWGKKADDGALVRSLTRALHRDRWLEIAADPRRRSMEFFLFLYFLHDAWCQVACDGYYGDRGWHPRFCPTLDWRWIGQGCKYSPVFLTVSTRRGKANNESIRLTHGHISSFFLFVPHCCQKPVRNTTNEMHRRSGRHVSSLQ